ncbi:hypothetical protein KKJ06_20530 [Xenorhabdus bovienii]|uniref:hypothetical protein n=1 Tax=Xenorhabdus bovienii TaxID=40576 RepID=UPI0023B2424F|nr:hypothetical protein [Xenorhabdus bovienii]MDE9483962.1 hypothetical protein [Xenorhabdus bovienii]MDE9552688.1 hypothetical protein [Xenorhabdus bovienii]MDE9557735.1 hypothetical protein [Xenorhabdus bovienii]MDE9566331.1 hypothetical protein [Xenorhabdus bovienii]
MVTPEGHYQFLKKHFRAKRFEERNGNVWGDNYSHNIAAHHYKDLKYYGYSLIGQHKAVNGEGVIYDANLTLLESIPQKGINSLNRENQAVSNDIKLFYP